MQIIIHSSMSILISILSSSIRLFSLLKHTIRYRDVLVVECHFLVSLLHLPPVDLYIFYIVEQ